MLEKKYPFLFQFFTGYFPEADLEQLTDYEIVKNYILENSEDIITNTQQELSSVLLDSQLWQEITTESNRYFKTDIEIKEWLEMILLQFSHH